MTELKKDSEYTHISHAFLDALSKTNIPSYDRKVFDCIVMLTQGLYNRSVPITLDTFKNYTGLTKPHICCSIRRLLDRNLILRKKEAKETIYNVQEETNKWKKLSKSPKRLKVQRELNLKTRFKILLRDDFTCQYCGAKAPDVRLHVDHIIPKSKGGGDEDTNRITACIECNQGKSGINYFG